MTIYEMTIIHNNANTIPKNVKNDKKERRN